MNKSQLVKDTTEATQHTERAHWSAGAKWPRTLHTQSNTPSGHTGERKPSGQGHWTDSTPSGHTGEWEPMGGRERPRTRGWGQGGGPGARRGRVTWAPEGRQDEARG